MAPRSCQIETRTDTASPPTTSSAAVVVGNAISTCPQSPSSPSQQTSSAAVRGPGHQASILNNIGATLHRLGDYRRALSYYQQAVDVRMTAIQSERKGVPSNITDDEAEANCVRLEGDLRMLERTLDERGEGASATTTPASVDMYQMFDSRRDENDASFYAFTDPTFLVSPRQQQQTATEERDDTYESVVTIHNMGLSHLISGSYTKAAKLFDMALRVITSRPPTSHKEVVITAAVRLDVAHVRYRAGDVQESSRSIASALELSKSSLALEASQGQGRASNSGEIKTSVADALSLLSRLHHESSNSADGALDLAREALRLRRSLHGDSHIAVASTLYNIGLILQGQGKLDDAIEHVRWFVQFVKKEGQQAGAGGAGAARYAPHLAESLHALGVLHLENGCVAQAIESLTESVSISRTRTSGAASAAPSTADALQVLGQIMFDSGRYDQALIRYDEALRIETALVSAESRSSSSDEDNEDHNAHQEPPVISEEGREGIATILCSVGQTQQALGQLDAALESYTRVLSISRSLLGQEDEFVADLLSIIGNLHLERGETSEAVRRFADATRIFRRVAEERGDDFASGASPSSRMISPDGGNVPVVMGMAGGFGIEFHPHAAAA